MPAHQSIDLELVSPEALLDTSGDYLEIVQPEEQEPPDGGFLAWVVQTGRPLTLETIEEYFSQYKSPCQEDGTLEVEIQIHRSRPDLEYTIAASYGELGEKIAATGEHTYSETVTATDHLGLQRQIVGQGLAKWEGPVIGTDRKVITPPPEFTWTATGIEWGVVCSGTIRLKFSEEHDTYILTIVPRTGSEVDPDDLSTAYQSTVIAVWDGGPVTHEVELPDMNGFCGGSNVANDPDDAKCYDLYEVYERCKPDDEPISKRLVRVPCPEQDEEE